VVNTILMHGLVIADFGLYHWASVSGIKLENVSKAFGGVIAVDDISLDVPDGEFLVLVGPSGCGKSTLLRMIAGLEQVTSGGISIGGRDVTDMAPKDRDVAMVFQSYALYPHMSVRQNLGYGLKVRGTEKVETARRVEEVAALLGLSTLLERRPAQLSGGQRQRVAMGRAIVREPQAFLLDEPLSNLDAQLRVGMRASLAQLHGRLNVTTVYVTHDQVEAMTLGQRVAVMRNGKIVQVDAPQRLYSQPGDVYVATFIGSPAMNLVEATVEGGVARFGDHAIPLAAGARPPDGEVILGIRPEDFDDAANSPGLPTIEVTVDVLEELGSDSYVFFSVAARPVLPHAPAPDAGDDSRGLLPAAGALLTARVDARTAARVGGRVELAVDPRRLHFFDRDTGLRLEREASSSGAPAELTTSR
jgi:multiple sugar transport system ATP-binding protein